MSKTAVVVCSDPDSGSEEALGRVFNAMFLVFEIKEKGEEVELMFQGTGTRWPAKLVDPTHPANALYRAIQDKVSGVCGGCADVFGATEAAENAGVTLVRNAEIPGTNGIQDLSRYLSQGYNFITF